MLRIPRKELNEAIESVLVLMAHAKDASGLRVMVRPNPESVEKGICAMLSQLTGTPGPDVVLPDDIQMTGLEPWPSASALQLGAEARRAATPRIPVRPIEGDTDVT